MTDETNAAGQPEKQEANPAAKASLMGSVRSAIGHAVTHILGTDEENLDGRSSNELAEIRTKLAVSRNLMAADRTLMAWIRTALSMDSFGFTIYKLLETYQSSGVNLPKENTPRDIGLFLTGIGTFSMVMGVLEYWHTIKELRHLQDIGLARPTFIMGILMAVMGLFLFFSIITKLF